jgi:hypothetical protein
MLHDHSQWHTKIAPNPTKNVQSVKEENTLSNKIDAILAYIAKQNNDNVPLQDLVGSNSESADVNFIRSFANKRYGNNYNNGCPPIKIIRVATLSFPTHNLMKIGGSLL